YAPACVDPQAFFKVGPEDPKNDPKAYGDTNVLLVANGKTRSGLGQRQFSAIILTNPDADSGPLNFDVTLARGPMREVTILDPDGRPLIGAVVTDVDGQRAPAGPLETATFTAFRLKPLRTRRLTIRHDERRLSGSVLLLGDDVEPTTVRLQPWATITG